MIGFNLFDFFGRTLAGYIQWPKERYVIFPVMLRYAFFIFFLFCQTSGIITDSYT
eukprot:Pgem_evm1s17065